MKNIKSKIVILNSYKEAKKLVRNNTLYANGDLILKFNLTCNWDIVAKYIDAKNIDARNISTWNIDAKNINTWNIYGDDINALNITTWDIRARNINSWDINAWNIDAMNINARSISADIIDAWDINYFAVCYARESFRCRSVVGRRSNSKHFCLDSEIEIIR